MVKILVISGLELAVDVLDLAAEGFVTVAQQVLQDVSHPYLISLLLQALPSQYAI